MPAFAPALEVPKLITPPVTAKPAVTPVSTSDALTLDALMKRQEDIAASQAAAMKQPIASPEQGYASLAWALVNGLRARKAERELAQGQHDVANAFATGIDPKTGALTPEAMGVLAQRSPDLAVKMQIEAMAARQAAAKEDQWRPIPTPEGENGQWFQNQYGDTKKVGGGAPGEGQWKPSDIGGLRDDYTKAAGVWDQAAPAWQSMQESFNRVKDLKEGQTQEGAGTADYALVIGLAKLMDPNSVVREGEVESVRRTGGATDRFISMLSDLSGGGSLSPAVRRGLMTEASTRMKAYYDQVKTKRDAVSEIATRHNIDPRDVVYPLAEFTPYAPEDPNKPQVVDELPDPTNLPDGTTATNEDGIQMVVKGHKWVRA